MNFLQVVAGYVALLAPQLFAQFSAYAAAHPSPALNAAVTVVGAILLHGATPPKK